MDTKAQRVRSPKGLNLRELNIASPTAPHSLPFVPFPVPADGTTAGGNVHAMEMEHPGSGGTRGGIINRLRNSLTMRLGTVLLILGVLLAIFSTVFDSAGNSIRTKKIKEQLVVSSTRHPQYKAWASDSDSNTPMYHDYTLFDITNPADFLKGGMPIVQEVGPFSFVEKSSKYDIRFSEGGTQVSYVTLSQLHYTGDPADLQQSVWSYNLPYAVAMSTIGGEQNILKAGTQQAVLQIEKALTDTFVPAVREAAIVQCINEGLTIVQQTVAAMTWGNTAGAIESSFTSWGGGCTTVGLTRSCGFGAMAGLFAFIDPNNDANLDLLQTCLYTRLPQDNPVPTNTVRRILDKTNQFSIMNTDIDETTLQRKGVSLWLWGNEAAKTQIMNQFGISSSHFETLRGYLRNIYNNAGLEDMTLKTFYGTFKDTPEQPEVMTTVIKWSDFAWRQWAVGDVRSRLLNATVPQSIVTTGPKPEYAWFAESVGITTFKYANNMRLTKQQTQCFFELGHNSFESWVSDLLSIDVYKPSRASFLNAGLNGGGLSGTPTRTEVNPRDCFKTGNDWIMLQSYLDYLAKNFVEPEFQKSVLLNNSGLLTRRTIQETLTGYQSPILQLSLAPDDPRARSFAFAVNDTSLSGPAECKASADMSNAFTACSLESVVKTDKPDGSTVVMRKFKKTPHTYYTGKDKIELAGSLARYHGDKSVSGVWRSGSVQVDGGAKSYPGSVQDSYSLGRQFPPFNKIDKPDAVLSVFERGFVVPLRFRYDKDVENSGIKLKRFVFTDDTFSPSRPDASIFAMSPGRDVEGALNLTDVVGAKAYFTAPHFGGDSLFSDVGGYAAFDPERDMSYIDVEPITGKTMSALMQLQVAAAVPAELFTEFHPKVRDVPYLPILYVRQHANVSSTDADFFKSQVYGSEKMINVVSTSLLWAGVAALVAGFILVVLDYARGDVLRRSGQGEQDGGSFKQPQRQTNPPHPV